MDREELLDALAACYVRAALDALFEQLAREESGKSLEREPQPASPHATAAEGLSR